VSLALLWGVLPGVSGHPARRRSGWLLLAGVAPLMVMLAVSRRLPLLVRALAVDDKLQHAAAGLLLTLALLWLVAGRRRLLVAAALALSVAGALLGEGVQWFTTRAVEVEDLIAHLLGAAIALGLFLLVRAALWSESPDVPRARSGTYGG
jgi:VanZ family protein